MRGKGYRNRLFMKNPGKNIKDGIKPSEEWYFVRSTTRQQ
jgi:hypothetical protein